MCAPCCGWLGTHPRFEHRRAAGPARHATKTADDAHGRAQAKHARTRDAGRNTRRHPDNAPLPSSLGGNIPLPGPPPPACPCPLPSAHHPRLFSSSPDPSYRAPFLRHCPVLPCLLHQLGLSWLSALRVRKPQQLKDLAWAPAGRRERYVLASCLALLASLFLGSAGASLGLCAVGNRNGWEAAVFACFASTFRFNLL